MKRTPVDSSAIASVGYDPATATLEIEFTNNLIYRYRRVPAHIHSGLMSADSCGQYFNTEIKPTFDYEEIT
jgi:hypothetical protein